MLHYMLMGIAGYLVTGLLLLFLFNLITHRIQDKLVRVTYETQSRLIASGNPTGYRSSMFIFIVAMWLLWPLVFIGAITESDAERDNDR